MESGFIRCISNGKTFVLLCTTAQQRREKKIQSCMVRLNVETTKPKCMMAIDDESMSLTVTMAIAMMAYVWYQFRVNSMNTPVWVTFSYSANFAPPFPSRSLSFSSCLCACMNALLVFAVCQCANLHEICLCDSLGLNPVVLLPTFLLCSFRRQFFLCFFLSSRAH